MAATRMPSSVLSTCTSVRAAISPGKMASGTGAIHGDKAADPTPFPVSPAARVGGGDDSYVAMSISECPGTVVRGPAANREPSQCSLSRPVISAAHMAWTDVHLDCPPNDSWKWSNNGIGYLSSRVPVSVAGPASSAPADTPDSSSAASSPAAGLATL